MNTMLLFAALKVLAIGNSFSACLQDELPSVAKSLGQELDLATAAIWGCPLDRHYACLTNSSDHSYFLHWNRGGVKSASWPEIESCLVDMPETEDTKRGWSPKRGVNLAEILKSEKWDVVTLQQGSPLSWVKESYSPWGDLLVEHIRRVQPQAKIYFQETWSYTPWDKRLKKWKITPDEMSAKIHEAAAAFASRHAIGVIPSGSAVQAWRRALPVAYGEKSFGGDVVGGGKDVENAKFVLEDGKWVPKCDVCHLNSNGCYLQALVWAKSLFGVDVGKCEHQPKALAPERAALMKRVVAHLGGNDIAFAKLEDLDARGYAADRMQACYRNKVAKTDPMYFAREFRYPAESGAWQGEFWGKCMLSAVPYAFWMRDDALKAKIAASVREVIANQEPNGYIGNYPPENRAGGGWDIWGNKYTLLGLLTWHRHSGDVEARAAAERLAGYLMDVFGPGKRHLNETGCYRGLPSCSVLEAIVMLYNVTGKIAYRDFAAYIVDELDLAGRAPRLLADAAVPPGARVTAKDGESVAIMSSRKAYEMMSCYQGLLAYARSTGDRRALEAAVKTAELIARDEINIVGGGASCENWFGGAARQTRQFVFENETCVITTWMRLCQVLLSETGDAKWADELERTFYNAYLGAQRPDGSDFVQYTSLCGRRHAGENQSRLFVNCCTANGPRGYLAFFGSAMGAEGRSVYVNQYVSGSASVMLPGSGERISLETYSEYPKNGAVSMRYRERKTRRFELKLRIPGWSKTTVVSVNGKRVDDVRPGTYLRLDREWKCGDNIEIALDYSPRTQELDGHVAFLMGPLVLARDCRFDDGDIGETIARHRWIPDPLKNLRLFPTRTRRDDMHFTAMGLLVTGAHTKNAGEKYPSVINFCDYGSAGNTWTDESSFRVWLPMEAKPEELNR